MAHERNAVYLAFVTRGADRSRAGRWLSACRFWSGALRSRLPAPVWPHQAKCGLALVCSRNYGVVLARGSGVTFSSHLQSENARRYRSMAGAQHFQQQQAFSGACCISSTEALQRIAPVALACRAGEHAFRVSMRTFGGRTLDQGHAGAQLVGFFSSSQSTWRLQVVDAWARWP